MEYVFPVEAIEFLRSCRHDPAASLGYEMLSGGVYWDDENYLDFMVCCRANGCEEYGCLFAYRTSLLKGAPYEDYRSTWEEVRERCPEWIGFRPERTTGTAELLAWIKQAEDDY